MLPEQPGGQKAPLVCQPGQHPLASIGCLFPQSITSDSSIELQKPFDNTIKNKAIKRSLILDFDFSNCWDFLKANRIKL
jgi:hypothetical protein